MVNDGEKGGQKWLMGVVSESPGVYIGLRQSVK